MIKKITRRKIFFSKSKKNEIDIIGCISYIFSKKYTNKTRISSEVLSIRGEYIISDNSNRVEEKRRKLEG
jgi:hypothetical protein